MTRSTGRFLLILLGLYTLFRLFTTGVLLWIVAEHQDPVIFSGEVPRYFDLATLWDGAWYERIATEGYPDQLPVNDQGQVRQNEWAFYPIFPLLAKGLMLVTGLPFAVAGPVVATVLGYAAAVVMGLLLRERVGTPAALGGVALFAAFPAAPTLQVAYTESLATLLLCAVLWLLIRERWWAAGAVALLTGLARPIALPLGLVALVAVIVRWRGRAERPLSRREAAGMFTALAGCGASGLIWPALVWLGTGVPDGYPVTMSAWRQGEPVTPFAPTLDMVQFLFGDFRGLVYLVGFLVLLGVMMLGPWARGLGPVLQTWALAYPFYLAAALDPWTSIYRYLILLFPAFVVLIGGGWPRADARATATWLIVLRTVVIAALFLAWQVWWSWELFRFEPPRDNPP
ncbi:hypothetical protein [Ornithinimicrobium cryptoxanthini]|uniref:Uncharacterized protein n=1 Tax=Ornithinimicrobium cryptoxanthini TaxID=2934161 RepID=A0ABY4YJY8_9MICO|nr:hypothetical protein [Ornithinimicrobium cryptoxanthini]USQ77110.1 hypothetical protein NF557_04115 [Ornithinimicrobium cryptoxanthini]